MLNLKNKFKDINEIFNIVQKTDNFIKDICFIIEFCYKL